MAKINFTNENMAQLREKIADAIIDNIVVKGPLGQEYTVPELMQLSTNSLKALSNHLEKTIAQLTTEDEWIENPNEILIKNITFKKELVSLIRGYKLYLDELATRERERERIIEQIKQIEESQKTPGDLLKELQDKLASLE